MDHNAPTSEITIRDWIAPLVAAKIASKLEDLATDIAVHHDEPITDPDILIERLVQVSDAFDRMLWEATDAIVEDHARKMVAAAGLPAGTEDRVSEVLNDSIGDSDDYGRAVIGQAGLDFDGILDGVGGISPDEEAARDYVRTESAALAARRF